MPAPRNLTSELDLLRSQGNAFIGSNYDNFSQFGNAYTGQNLRNFGTAMVGDGADVSGGAAGLMRQGWDQANPQYAGFIGSLPGTMNQIGAMAPGAMNPTGYSAVEAGAAPQAGFSGARAMMARGRSANGGPLLGGLERDAGRNLGQVSPLQMMQERQAMEMLGAGGGLSRGEEMGVQDSVRSAYADRGLLRSNRGIGAEILATDSARRNRMFENQQFASGIDRSGQDQRNASRTYAMGVQGRGQDLSTFNTGQANQLSQYNAGMATDIGRFNAGLATQNNQFNAGLQSNTNQFNANANNRAQEFNVGAVNRAGEFNNVMGRDLMNDAWGRTMGAGQIYQGASFNPAGTAGALMGNVPDYTNGMMGYGGDLYNTNYNAAMAAKMGKANNSAGLWSGVLGAVGGIGGAIIGGPVGASIGSKLGSVAGGYIGGGGGGE